jgi:hypothetical protein
MRSRLCILILSLASAPAFANEEALLHPAAPLVTTCNCASINGTCQADCSIVCNSGYGNCNGNVADGCEASLNDPSTCGTCDNDCTSCNEGGVCNNGTCGGSPLPNGTACRGSQVCIANGSSGVCVSGQCLCGDTVDMAGSSPSLGGPHSGMHPADIPGDCSFTGGGTASAFMILLVSVVLLLNRRRQSR